MKVGFGAIGGSGHDVERERNDHGRRAQPKNRRDEWSVISEARDLRSRCSRFSIHVVILELLIDWLYNGEIRIELSVDKSRRISKKNAAQPVTRIRRKRYQI